VQRVPPSGQTQSVYFSSICATLAEHVKMEKEFYRAKSQHLTTSLELVPATRELQKICGADAASDQIVVDLDVASGPSSIVFARIELWFGEDMRKVVCG
jgi:hypothetical protein